MFESDVSLNELLLFFVMFFFVYSTFWPIGRLLVMYFRARLSSFGKDIMVAMVLFKNYVAAGSQTMARAQNDGPYHLQKVIRKCSFVLVSVIKFSVFFSSHSAFRKGFCFCFLFMLAPTLKKGDLCVVLLLLLLLTTVRYRDWVLQKCVSYLCLLSLFNSLLLLIRHLLWQRYNRSHIFLHSPLALFMVILISTKRFSKCYIYYVFFTNKKKMIIIWFHISLVIMLWNCEVEEHFFVVLYPIVNICSQTAYSSFMPIGKHYVSLYDQFKIQWSISSRFSTAPVVVSGRPHLQNSKIRS